MSRGKTRACSCRYGTVERTVRNEGLSRHTRGRPLKPDRAGERGRHAPALSQGGGRAPIGADPPAGGRASDLRVPAHYATGEPAAKGRRQAQYQCLAGAADHAGQPTDPGTTHWAAARAHARRRRACSWRCKPSRCRTTIRRLAAELNGVAEAFAKTFKRDYARSAGSATGLDQQGGVFVKSWWWRWPEKLLIALWRFVIDGVLPESAVLKPAAAEQSGRAANTEPRERHRCSAWRYGAVCNKIGAVLLELSSSRKRDSGWNRLPPDVCKGGLQKRELRLGSRPPTSALDGDTIM